MVVCWCNHSPPFVRVLFGVFEVSTLRLGLFSAGRFSTVRLSFRLVFLEFLAVRAVYNRLFGAFPVRLRFWLVHRELVEKRWFCGEVASFCGGFLLFESTFLKFFGVHEVLTD